jgi:transcriptional regulator with PAS, ATPase and Fis domain
VERGKFRRDLYYRLNIMSFHLPPLRERVQDIGPLARSMTARFTKRFDKDLFDIHPKTLAALEAFPWQGNIRQLENVIQQAVLVSSGPELLLEHLPPPVQEHTLRRQVPDCLPTDSLYHNREQLERTTIQRVLINTNFSRRAAAEALGVSRVTLYKKMKKYGLMPARD